MLTRIITALIGIPILLGLCYYGSWPLLLAIMALAGLCAYELSQMLKAKQFAVFSGLNICLSVVIAGALGFGNTPIWLWALLKILTLGFYLFLAHYNKTSIKQAFMQAIGIIYIGVGFGALASLRLSDSFTLILLAFIIVWLTDSAAYFVGSAIGKHKMAPVISPNKSWEGFLGGLIAALIVAGIYMIIVLDMPLYQAFLLAIFFSVLGQLGDLAESAIKRYCGVKDSGSLIPGHGGVFDRFDSVILVAPFMHLFLIWL